jgi:inorganic pyrophosphatase
MDEKKYVQKLLQISKNYDMDRIRNVKYSEEYHPFEGSPKRHPTNENILILIANPFEENKQFYEFHLDTISAVEEIGTLTSDDNKSSYQIRVWVKKGTMAVKSETFIV